MLFVFVCNFICFLFFTLGCQRRRLVLAQPPRHSWLRFVFLLFYIIFINTFPSSNEGQGNVLLFMVNLLFDSRLLRRGDGLHSLWQPSLSRHCFDNLFPVLIHILHSCYQVGLRVTHLLVAVLLFQICYFLLPVLLWNLNLNRQHSVILILFVKKVFSWGHGFLCIQFERVDWELRSLCLDFLLTIIILVIENGIVLVSYLLLSNCVKP